MYFSAFGLNSASTRSRTLAIICFCWPEILKSIFLTLFTLRFCPRSIACGPSREKMR